MAYGVKLNDTHVEYVIEHFWDTNLEGSELVL